MATKKELLERAGKLERKIKSGKLNGKKLRSAKSYMYQLRSKANGAAKKTKKTKAGKPTWTKSKSAKAKANGADPMQGILPGFTDLVAPRASEIARELVFNALRKAIAEEVEQVVRKLKVV